VLRLNVEARTPEDVVELTGRVEAIIKEHT
jgi:hypothetical protein